jgi:hypothetical protein
VPEQEGTTWNIIQQSCYDDLTLIAPEHWRGGFFMSDPCACRNLPEHWLLKLLEQGEGDLTVLARRYEWDMDRIWQSLLSWLDTSPAQFAPARSFLTHSDPDAGGLAAASR